LGGTILRPWRFENEAIFCLLWLGQVLAPIWPEPDAVGNAMAMLISLPRKAPLAYILK